jgi:hypothetical protein
MSLDLNDFTNVDPLPIIQPRRRDALYGSDLQARHREPMSQLLHRHGNLDELS